MSNGNQRRQVTLALIVLLIVVGSDSDRVPFVNTTLLALVYFATASAYLIGLCTGRRSWYRLATATLVAVSISRALLYFLDDQRIAPFGLNGTIAVLAIATYMGRKGDAWRR